MITNTSVSKTPSEYVDVPKYIGVASVKVVGVNPNNAKLRSFGWQIPEDADEPNYVTTTTNDDGTPRKSARVRFMVQIQELEGKPVIPIDFWIHPNAWLNSTGEKCQIIDQFGRTAWGTQEEIASGSIPQYKTGAANIALPYKPAHRGEENLVRFLMKYLCCTPFEIFDKEKNAYVKTKNPGKLTIDDWKSLCDGNASEIRSYIATQPDNLVKIVLGVRQTEDNKTYQVFIDDTFLGNGSRPNGDGVYANAQKAIDRLADDGYHDDYQFSARTVAPFVITPTDVAQDDVKHSAGVTSDELNSIFSNGERSSDTGNTEFEDDLPF